MTCRILPTILFISAGLVLQSVSAAPANGTTSQATGSIIDSPHKQLKQEEVAEAAGAGAAAAGAAGAAAAAAGDNNLYSTYANVGTILNGVVSGDIGNILSGGTAFIPPGDLRNTVTTLLQNAVIPTVNRVATDIGQNIQSRLNATTETPPPPPPPVPTAHYPTRGHVRYTTTTSSPAGSFFQAIQNRFQQGSENGPDPLKAIQNRLQSFFGFGGGSSSSSSSSSSTGSAANNVRNVQSQGSNIANEGNNKYRLDIVVKVNNNKPNLAPPAVQEQFQAGPEQYQPNYNQFQQPQILPPTQQQNPYQQPGNSYPNPSQQGQFSQQVHQFQPPSPAFQQTGPVQTPNVAYQQPIPPHHYKNKRNYQFMDTFV